MQSMSHNDKLDHVLSSLASCSVETYIQAQHLNQAQRLQNTSDGAPVQPNLEGVPLDVLLEVMAYLEWCDLLRLRQVSTSLNTATRHRTLWHNYIKSSPSRFCLSKRIQVTSSQELEDAFLKAQKADRRWANPGPPRYMNDISDIRLYGTNSTILPGGRWLFSLRGLIQECTGAYLDLNAPEEGWKTLIPAFEPAVNLRFAMDSIMDVDLEAEAIAFTIVTRSTRAPYNSPSSSTSNFVVWRCASEFDDDGNEIGLKAEEVATIVDSEGWFCSEHICLKGNYLALLARTSENGSYTVVVIDWTLANGCVGADIPRFCFPDSDYGPQQLNRHAGFVLFPQSKKLLVRMHVHWYIMCWDGASPRTTFDPNGTVCGSLLLIPGMNSTLEFVEHNGNVSAVGCSLRGRCFQLSFQLPNSNPSTSQHTVTTENLYTLDQLDCRGHFIKGGRALFVISHPDQPEDTALFLCTYPLHNAHNRVKSEKHWAHIPSLCLTEYVFMDPVSGRCVFASVQGRRTYIVDF